MVRILNNRMPTHHTPDIPKSCKRLAYVEYKAKTVKINPIIARKTVISLSIITAKRPINIIVTKMINSLIKNCFLPITPLKLIHSSLSSNLVATEKVPMLVPITRVKNKFRMNQAISNIITCNAGVYQGVTANAP